MLMQTKIPRRWLIGPLAVVLTAALVVWIFFPDLFELLATGDERALEVEPTADPARSRRA